MAINSKKLIIFSLIIYRTSINLPRNINLSLHFLDQFLYSHCWILSVRNNQYPVFLIFDCFSQILIDASSVYLLFLFASSFLQLFEACKSWLCFSQQHLNVFAVFTNFSAILKRQISILKSKASASTQLFIPTYALIYLYLFDRSQIAFHFISQRTYSLFKFLILVPQKIILFDQFLLELLKILRKLLALNLL